MATKRGKGSSFEAEMESLAEVATDPRSEDARSRLRAGLRSARAPVVTKAAKLIQAHHLEGFETDLAEAFERFLAEPPKSDPACLAKVGTLEALDYAESLDAAPFLRAVRFEQKQWMEDTAGGVRARGILGLARIGHEDFPLVAAHLLSDELPMVRQAALEGLEHRGDSSGAALALVALEKGDADPMVVLAAMTTLLRLAPAWALKELRTRLDGEDERDRELAALALGQSRGDEALTVLLESLERCVRPTERAPLLRGIGLHRSDRALEAMLKVVAERSPADAKLAIQALAARKFDPGVTERVRAAAGQNERTELVALVDELFA